MKIELGDKVKDKVTGFEGIVTSRCIFLSGCDRFGVQAPVKAGEIKDAVYFDEVHLEVVKKLVVVPASVTVSAGTPLRGGPRPNPTVHRNPTR